MTELRDFTSDGGFTRTMAHQVDVDAGTAAAHDFGERAMPGECVVAPRPGGTAEEDAWALLFVHQRDGSSTELVILEGRPLRIPSGGARAPARSRAVRTARRVAGRCGACRLRRTSPRDQAAERTPLAGLGLLRVPMKSVVVRAEAIPTVFR